MTNHYPNQGERTRDEYERDAKAAAKSVPGFG